MRKTHNTKAALRRRLSVFEEILINKKGFFTRVKECGVNLKTARF